jgi:predicted ATP-grasp superfamily ATP-dependent carboligase
MVLSLKILISEYVLSTYQDLYLDLLPEAYAMVITLAKTLSMADCTVYLTISNKAPRIPWDKVVIVGSEEEYYYLIERMKEDFDWVVLIAPPLELIKLSRIVGSKLLGPPPTLVEVFSNKYTTYLTLKRCGVKTPETILVDDSPHNICLDSLNIPYVVKPTLSAGSEGVYLTKSKNEVVELIHRIRRHDPNNEVLIQEYVNGVHGSISVIYGEDGYLLYSLNLQLIILSGNRLKYMGGVLPIRNQVLKEKAEDILNNLFKCHPELRGYIGLDVVWDGEDVYVIEVNPRATTSVIGIYEVFPQLGEFLVKSVSRYRSKNEHYFLGDLVSDYAYFLILSKTTPTLANERSIDVGDSPNTILVGRSRSKDVIVSRVVELLHTSKLVYDLTHAFSTR